MSTATGANNGYADCDEFISHRLKAARSRIKRTDLLTASLLAGVLLIGYVLVFTILDHWVIDGGFSATTRATLLVSVLLLCAAIVYRYVIRPWTQQVHPLYAAKVLDESDEEMNGALLSLVDLDHTDSPATDAIRRTMEKRAAVRLTEVSVDEAIDRGWLMNLSVTLFVLVLATCIYAVFSPKTINLLRPLSLSSAAVATQTKILRVQPGATSVQAGGELEVVAVIGGQIPESVTVLYTTADQTYVDEVLTMSATDETGRFRLSMVGDGDRGLRQDFTYQVVAGDTRSEVFDVAVDQPPTCSVTQTSYQYPDYMELPPRQTQNGNLDAWDGTRVSLVAESTTPVRLAILQFSRDAAFSTPDIEIALGIDGTRLTGAFNLELDQQKEAPKFYRINVTDLDGRVDPQPTVYSVKVRPDQKPNVRLLDPTRDLRVPANAVVPLLIEAEDPDFLLSSVKIGVVINNERVSDEIVFDGSRATPTSRWNGIFDFELKNFDLKEGDVVRYQVIARDNKPPIGTASRSDELQLFIERRVSQEEVEQQRKRDRESQERRMQQEATPQDQQPNDNNEATSQDNAADGQPGGQGDGTGEPGAEGDPAGEPGDAGQQRPGDGTSDNANRTETGSEGRATDHPSAAGNESERPDSDDEGGNQQAGEGASSQRPDNATAAEDRGEVSDDEAMQELLNAYRDALKNAEESPQEPSADNVQPGAETNDQPAGAGGDSVDPSTDSADSSEENRPGEGSDTSVDDATSSDPATVEPAIEGDPSKQGEPDAQEGDPNKQGEPDAQEGDPNMQGEPGAQEGDPNKQGEPGAQEGDPNKQGEPDAQEGDPNKQGEPGAQEGDPNKQGEPDAQEGDPNKQGEPGAQEGDPNKQGEPVAQEGDPNKQGEPGAQEGDPNRQGEPGMQEGDPNKQGEPGAQEGDPSKQGGESGKQGGESGKQGGESGKQGGESGKQGGESGKQGGESGKQGGEGGKQGGESGKQGGESGKQGGESGKQGGESGKQGGEGGQQGGEGGKQGGAGGKQGGEGGKQGGAGGKQGGEGGQQGGKQGGKQGGEGGKQGGAGGKQGGEGGKQGGESGKQGGESGKQGGEGGKQGGESGKQGGEGGQQGGESGKQGGEGGQQGGEGGQQGGEGGKQGGQGGGQSGQRGGQPGTASGGGNPAGGMGEGSGPGKQTGGNEQGGPQAGNGSGNGDDSSADFQPDEANVEDAAQAADLVLKRLQKDLDRGQVDKQLLEKLGWTESELEAFSQRMQKQLSQLEDRGDEQSRSEQRQRRRVEELLKSLDLTSRSRGRVGRSNRDREIQDTTARQTAPPTRYRDQMKLYERSLSEGRRR